MSVPTVSDGWIEVFDVETGRTRVLSRREIAPAGRARRRVAGRNRARSRATRTSTSFAWDWTDGRWRPRSWSSPPSGGSGKCDEQNLVSRPRSHGGRCHLLERFPHLQARRQRLRGVKRKRVRFNRTRSGAGGRRIATAVRVGERFGLVLTCGVIEAGPITVVPVLNQLEPGALSLTPFEVVSGARRRGRGGAAVALRPVRVLSAAAERRLLRPGRQRFRRSPSPTTCRTPAERRGGIRRTCCPRCRCGSCRSCRRARHDIRDASGQTFASIESRRFRASLANILAWVSFAFAGVLAIFALVQAVRHFRSKSVVAVRKLPVPSVLGGCLDTISEVASDASKTGWSPDLARRAAAAMRIAGAVALGRPVAQSFVGPDAVERDGQVDRSNRVDQASARAALGVGHVEGDRQSSRQRPQNPARNARATRVDFRRARRLQRRELRPQRRSRIRPRSTLRVESSKDAIRALRTSARWPMRTAGAVMRSITIGG